MTNRVQIVCSAVVSPASLNHDPGIASILEWMDARETQIHLLGPPRATQHGAPVNLRYRKSWSLLGLVLASRRAWARARLAATFWPDADDTAARTNLRVLLSDLNRRLPGVLTVTREHVERDPSRHATCDLDALEAWLGRPHAHPNPAVMQPLLEGTTDEDTPDFNDWLQHARETLDLQYLQAWRGVADRALLQDREHDASTALTHAATIEPWNEALQTTRIRLLLRTGDTALARAVLAQTQRAVRTHLEAETGPSVTRLERLAHEANNLSDWTAHTFVGHHQAITQAAKTLAEYGRLAVVGPPGSGRSRFVAALALDAVAVHGLPHLTVMDAGHTFNLGGRANDQAANATVNVQDTPAIAGVRTVAVPPLRLPDPGTTRLQNLLAASAGRLAMHGHSEDELPPQHVSAMTHLTRMTGGNPAALTYAADARERFLAYPPALLDLTVVARDFAINGRPDLADRIHHRLHELAPAAQALLRRLSTSLSGLADRHLKDAGATPEERREASNLERLGWLQPASLHGKRRRLEGAVLLVLHAEAAGRGPITPHPQHDVFVRHLLDSEEALRGPTQTETLSFFSEYSDDILQAVVQTAKADTALGLRVAASAWHLARRTGHVHLLAGHLQRLLEEAPSDGPLVRADAQSALANLKLIQGRAAEAYTLHEGVLGSLAEAPDTVTDPLHRARVLARSALTLAQIDARAGRSDEAHRRLDAVDALPDAPELAWFHAAGTVNRGFVLKSEGCHHDAHAHLSRGAKALWGLQDTMGEASARIGALASLARSGDATAAVRQQEALEKCFERMNGLGIGPLAAPLMDAMRDLREGGFADVAVKLGALHEQAAAASGRLES